MNKSSVWLKGLIGASLAALTTGLGIATNLFSQEKAISYGFRPADERIPLTTPFDKQHGVNPQEPTTLLEVLPAYIIREILTLWNERKKHTNVVLVLDISGSMMGDKLNNARQGALKFLAALGDADTVSLLIFNNKTTWLAKQLPLTTKRQTIERKIKNLFARGNTALYDAIGEAHQYLKQNAQAEKIAVVIVLSDGQDTSSQLKLEELLKQIPVTETTSILIFPVGYGEDADKQVLEKIANATKTKVYQGTIQDIEKVFLEISTFF